MKKNKQSELEYDWFGAKKKKVKPSKMSFLGLGVTPKRQKIPNKINFMGKPNSNFVMKPSPLFVKESIKKRKGLSKWGDADLDGTPNYFDCDPVNWMKDAKPVKRNIFQKIKDYPGKKIEEAKEKYSGKNIREGYQNIKKGLIESLEIKGGLGKDNKKSRMMKTLKESQLLEAKQQQIKDKLSDPDITPEEQKELKGKLKKLKKVEKIYAGREVAEGEMERFRKAMSLSGPAGKLATKQLAVDLRLEAGKTPSQRQIAALLAAEKKTKFLGKEGYGRRLVQGVPGLAQVEGVASVLGGYGLGEGGVYTKAMRAKSARVRRLTQVATGQVFGSLLTSPYASSEPRGRGRPAGPSGEYKIGGKPVYEEEFRQWEMKQRSLNRMLPSEQQSQTLNPEYLAYLKQQEVERFKEAQMKAQEQTPQEMTGPEGETITEPVPSDQEPKTEGMTTEEVQAIEEIRQRPYTRASMDEIRQAQQMAQKQDQILNAPNFMKGELKAAGGSILTPQGPQIMDAPNAFKGEMRNVYQTEEDGAPAVRLSERPQTNPYGDEYLEIELGSGKPVVRKRIREKWMTGEAL